MDTRWRIELLGRLRARYGGGEIARFPRPKAGELLAYLAYYPRRSHSREALIEVLWPEIDPELGRNALRKLLHWLRQQVELLGGDAEHLIVADRSSVSLRPEAFTTDVGEFTAALAAARAAPPGQPAARLAEAVARYGGDLLPDSFESWVLTEREALRGQYLDALHQLVAALEAAGDLMGALQGARQAVAADPLREEAHYDLMRLYAATGQPAACLRQYQELERLLREELDETPSAEARALAEELRLQARTLVVARQPPRAGRDGAPGAGWGRLRSGPRSLPGKPAPAPEVRPPDRAGDVAGGLRRAGRAGAPGGAGDPAAGRGRGVL